MAILGLAVARGLWIGLVREAFSLLAVASACLAVRMGTASAAPLLANLAPWALAPLAAKLLAGSLLALAALLAVGLLGRLLCRGLRAAGLGGLDRLGGGLMGLAEGTLVAAVLLLAAVTFLGPSHPWLSGSRAVTLLVEGRTRLTSAPDVAASPPPEASRRDGAP